VSTADVETQWYFVDDGELFATGDLDPYLIEKFKKNPKKFEPAYGGWCAYAMGKTGEKVEIDPASFKITDGRLFLFYKDFFTDTRDKWSKDEKPLNQKADTNWKKTSGEDAPKPTEAKPADAKPADGK
jgi:hypothetical protein